jgi:hypothetical protein
MTGQMKGRITCTFTDCALFSCWRFGRVKTNFDVERVDIKGSALSES